MKYGRFGNGDEGTLHKHLTACPQRKIVVSYAQVCLRYHIEDDGRKSKYVNDVRWRKHPQQNTRIEEYYLRCHISLSCLARSEQFSIIYMEVCNSF